MKVQKKTPSSEAAEREGQESVQDSSHSIPNYPEIHNVFGAAKYLELSWQAVINAFLHESIHPMSTKLVASAQNLLFTGPWPFSVSPRYRASEMIGAMIMLVDVAHGKTPTSRKGTPDNPRTVDELIDDLEAIHADRQNPVTADILQDLRQ